MLVTHHYLSPVSHDALSLYADTPNQLVSVYGFQPDLVTSQLNIDISMWLNMNISVATAPDIKIRLAKVAGISTTVLGTFDIQDDYEWSGGETKLVCLSGSLQIAVTQNDWDNYGYELQLLFNGVEEQASLHMSGSFLIQQTHNES